MWFDLGPKRLSLSYVHDGKPNGFYTDSSLHVVVCSSTFMIKHPFLIDVGYKGDDNALKCAPCIINNSSGRDEIDEHSDEKIKEHVGRILSRVDDKDMFTCPGHEFGGGAPEFRKNLLLYNIINGYKLRFMKNV